jgi:hypothetical protein
MAVDVAISPVPAPATLPTLPEPVLLDWSIEAAARVLSRLLERPLTCEQVLEKALAFGLVCAPAEGVPVSLTAQGLCRLFLAVYHIPAHLDFGTLQGIADYLGQGCLVFACLHDCAVDNAAPTKEAHGPQCLYQVLECDPRTNSVTLAQHPGPRSEVVHLPLAQFEAVWKTGGQELVVAARAWSDLPDEGNEFFGGFRDIDRAYHWNTAECDTDRTGRILRY